MDMNVDILIGVDIGGTFTDVVVRRSGAPARIMKIPSTPKDPSIAVLQALQRMQADWGLRPQQVIRFVHGTTVATNSVLERKGACVGLITTEGFRDVLEIGRQMRHQMYDLALDPETPIFLAPGRFRREVRERITASGEVMHALNEAAVATAADELIAAGAQAIAVVFLFSFLNDAHEIRAREIIAARHPGVFISLSSEVDPAFREYERTVVTSFDAYVKPIVDRYLCNLDAGLVAAHVTAPLQIMQSRGGISGSATARLRPVQLFLSGPAAGVIGARMVGEAAGCRNLITVDIGGTSCDIALIEDGAPALRSEGVIDGYVVRTSMVDVNSIGAGGGSIAWLDGANGLRVGPRSAGSEPGPACYGLGGSEPTVTDASVILGYLDPEHFAGGRLRLQPELSRRAIERAIARPRPHRRRALGIHRIVNAQVAEGIRFVSIRQGHDPCKFTLLPLVGRCVACRALADRSHISYRVFPCAIGGGTVGRTSRTGLRRTAVALDAPDLARPWHAAASRWRCRALWRRRGCGNVTQRYFADVCHAGQSIIWR
jgi:N-methylhydantoinase A